MSWFNSHRTESGNWLSHRIYLHVLYMHITHVICVSCTETLKHSFIRNGHSQKQDSWSSKPPDYNVHVMTCNRYCSPGSLQWKLTQQQRHLPQKWSSPVDTYLCSTSVSCSLGYPVLHHQPAYSRTHRLKTGKQLQWG